MLTPRPSSCDGCPLNTTAVSGFCPDKIPAKAKYLMWAEAPGKQEIQQSEPMVGKAGFVLKQWLMKAVPTLQLAMERGEVGFANTLRCLPPETKGRAYPTGETRRLAEAQCRQYDMIPESVHTIVLLGENAQRLFFREELETEDASDRRLGHDLKGVMGRIGREYVRDGKRWVFAPHPAYILRQPALVEHGQAALKISCNESVEVRVEYVEWNDAIQTLQTV